MPFPIRIFALLVHPQHDRRARRTCRGVPRCVGRLRLQSRLALQARSQRGESAGRTSGHSRPSQSHQAQCHPAPNSPCRRRAHASKIEPWSAFLTGSQGEGPGYDPLALAIREAHARGIELHAWFNPFRAATSPGGGSAANHVARTHPEWIRRHGSLLWIDPGEPTAREYVLDVILDVVRRYDIDGVHLDDYFYPYPAKGVSDFADES